ncbi:hypothetical protein V1477_017737 [Vespula maculifrons]|uniref:Uncharacterized protein n=1 Tax=Vespula maculifrons TaxID=7453 RepID=A0ABD2B148_VESMC
MTVFNQKVTADLSRIYLNLSRSNKFAWEHWNFGRFKPDLPKICKLDRVNMKMHRTPQRYSKLVEFSRTCPELRKYLIFMIKLIEI